jgi:hypothetical protein
MSEQKGGVLDTRNQIDAYRLVFLKKAMELEMDGFKMSRGTSATQRVREEYGINKRKKMDVYIAYCRITDQDPDLNLINRLNRHRKTSTKTLH